MPLLLVFFFSNMCARRVGIMMMLWVLRLSMIPIRDSLHGKNNNDKVSIHGDDEGRLMMRLMLRAGTDDKDKNHDHSRSCENDVYAHCHELQLRWSVLVLKVIVARVLQLRWLRPMCE